MAKEEIIPCRHAPHGASCYHGDLLAVLALSW